MSDVVMLVIPSNPLLDPVSELDNGLDMVHLLPLGTVPACRD